ncbi:MAG TPA: zinc-binding dehydrogenase [Humidesulfovibrio sp.]|uniref:zinc-binding dehydrogenase n=1 Tax=Humidesulfovibrio sp. TaxID=2910988 RepID=UPI002CB4E5B4|nr:zinc-binding dehydrogenase [Humidesulfovibrio sp.]HWR03890.1 zinc-binding dehydrogenase [Humidesulfovibrio sp.]
MQIKKTTAAILVEQKKPLAVAEISLPEELSFGQVLVKILYSGICGAQLNEIAGAKGPDKFLPHLLGHEAVAEVLEIGPGVKTVKPGMRVCLHWRPGTGLQCDPPKYDWNGQVVNAGWVTTFCRHAIISENRMTPVAEDFDPKLVPLLGCAVTTAMGVINNDAQVKIGQSVVVFGVGGVGLNIVQFAGLVAANPVIGVDINDEKKEMALKFGATHAFNSKKVADIAEEIKKIVGPGGADVVIDTTGNARMIELAYELTHADGRTILVGVPTKGDKVSIYTLPLHFKKVLKGSEGGSCLPALDIPRIIDLVKVGRVSLDGLVTHEFDLEDINDALDLVRTGQAGRVLIKM